MIQYGVVLPFLLRILTYSYAGNPDNSNIDSSREGLYLDLKLKCVMKYACLHHCILICLPFTVQGEYDILCPIPLLIYAIKLCLKTYATKYFPY